MKVKEDDDNTENAPQSLNVNEGQMFQNSTCNLVEKWTSSPKHYTEDTLLSAMETAGQRDVASMPDSVELSENEELVVNEIEKTSHQYNSKIQPLKIYSTVLLT
jgi:hypothetical protein